MTFSQKSDQQAPGRAIPVLLERCPSEADIPALVPQLLDEAGIAGSGLSGLRVLVKPNLLRAIPLACTSPAVVVAACAWLKDQGASVLVADSPGFGTTLGVAATIGLTEALRPLGLRVQPFHPGSPVTLACGSRLVLAKEALEADRILSAARFKAHSQMLLTFSCKNCYGCVPGLRKALRHANEGQDPIRFADMQASILGSLPPVAGLVDGVVAMHVTGPASGKPFPLGLLAASASPVALDEALAAVVGLSPSDVPLQAAFERAGHPDCAASGAVHVFPRRRPQDFPAEGFVLPNPLLHTSFRPWRLAKSLLRRVWYNLVH